MTVYEKVTAAIGSWCTANGYTPRAEIASLDGKNLPLRFVLFTQNSNDRVWYGDLPHSRNARVSFDIAVPEGEAARLPADFEALDATLLAAGFVPNGSYDMLTDHDARKTYITAAYTVLLPTGAENDGTV